MVSLLGGIIHLAARLGTAPYRHHLSSLANDLQEMGLSLARVVVTIPSTIH